MQKKLNAKTLRAAIKIAAAAATQDRAQLLLENIAAAFQTLTESDGNRLVLKRKRLRKDHFLRTMQQRSFIRAPKEHYSLDELATILHLPNKKLATIPNIAWGKTLLGEPPEDLPVVSKDTPPEIKNNINPFARTTYKNQQVVYGIKRNDRRRFMCVIGKMAPASLPYSPTWPSMI